MKSLIILVVSVAYIALCGATYSYPVPSSGIPLFNLNEGTGQLEFNRGSFVPSSHSTGQVYAESNKKEETSHHHSTTTTVHQTPAVIQTVTKPVHVPAAPVVVQHLGEKVEFPFYDTTTIFLPGSAEYERNMDLLQTLCAERDVITTQIEHITKIQKVSKIVRLEESEIMATLIRQREFLNFQINSLVSLLGLETTYSTQFQVVGTNQQAPQPHFTGAPHPAEKKIVFFEPISTIPAIFPPTPVKAETFHLTSTETHKPVIHPNVLSALEAQRDMINSALLKLSQSQSHDKTNLVNFYTTRREIINNQISYIKELQKTHTRTTTTETTKSTATHKKVDTNIHSTETTSTSGLLVNRLGVPTIQQQYEKASTHHPATTKAPKTTKVEGTTVFVEKPSEQTPAVPERDLLAVLMMIRDSLQKQIQLLVSSSRHQDKLGEDKESLLKTLRAECDVIDLQIAHTMGKFNTSSTSTSTKPTSTTTTEKVVETKTEHILVPHEQIEISRRYLPTY